MKTCKTCRFWSKDYHNVCDRIEFYDSTDTWSAKQDVGILVSVADDTSLFVQLKTSADFGCTLHEPKKT